MGDLGPELWNAEEIKILGTPVGSDASVQAASEDRLEEERRLWEAIPRVPYVQGKASCSAGPVVTTS